MLKLLFINLFVFSVSFAFAQNPVFEWAKVFKPANPATGKQDTRAMTIDANGNVYSTGYFTLTVDFDPGPGVYNLTSAVTAVFISKIDPLGNFIWAKQIDGSSTDIDAWAIALDPLGNIFVTGKFNSLTDFDPGPAVYHLNSSSGFRNTFILKLDNDGNFTWARSISNTTGSDNEGLSLKTDNSGNVYTIGYFITGADFDPGPAMFEMIATPEGSTYVLKLDANGNFAWAKQVDSVSPYCIAYDSNGAVCVTGYFTSTKDFDPGPNVQNLTAVGLSDAFILKLDLDGNFIWAKSIGGLSDEGGKSITTDEQGNVYSSGVFFNTADFDPGPGVYNLSTPILNFSEAFILKLDPQGNFIWARAVGGGSATTGIAICTDNHKNVYVTGNFWLTADFDPGPGIFNLTAGSSYNGYVLKLNPQGNFVWAKLFDGGLNSGLSIAVDHLKNVYTAGRFFQLVDFDTGPTFFYLTAAGSPNGFIHKLAQPCVANTFSTLDIFNCDNYTLNGQVYTTNGTYTQIIANTMGCDSTITLNLVIGKRSTSIDTAICEGKTYFAGGAAQTTAGIYKDTLQTTAGCDSIIITNLTVYPAPTPDLGSNRRLCQNASTLISPGTFSSYSWNDLSTGSTLAISNAGIYWVTVKNINGCSATDSLTIISVDTIPTNFLPADKQICPRETATISISGYKDYLWSTGAVAAPIQVEIPGDYYLTVTDYNNCSGKDTISVTLKTDCLPFGIPNAFTPNGDGLNDIFKPVIHQGMTGYSFRIFNRFGEKIFETKKYPGGWDGTYKGKAQAAGTYVYQISYIADNGWHAEENGTFLLLR